MDDVYNYNETICIETNESFLLSYLSRKSIFEEKVLVLIGGVYNFHALGVDDWEFIFTLIFSTYQV